MHSVLLERVCAVVFEISFIFRCGFALESTCRRYLENHSDPHIRNETFYGFLHNNNHYYRHFHFDSLAKLKMLMILQSSEYLPMDFNYWWIQPKPQTLDFHLCSSYSSNLNNRCHYHSYSFWIHIPLEYLWSYHWSFMSSQIYSHELMAYLKNQIDLSSLNPIDPWYWILWINYLLNQSQNSTH